MLHGSSMKTDVKTGIPMAVV